MSWLQRLAIGGVFIVLGMTLLLQSGSASIVAPLESIVKEADVIVVAHVENVYKIQGAHVAVASVQYSFKGAKAGDKLAFYAAPTWTCDTSEAVKGETALLCLATWKPGAQSMEGFYTPGVAFEEARRKRLPGISFYEITVSGRGRMPVLKAVRDRNYIERPVSAIFPESIPILWKKDKRGRNRPLAPLADVEKAIRSLLAHPEEANEASNLP